MSSNPLRRLASACRWRIAYWRLRSPKTTQELALDEERIVAELTASPIPTTPLLIDVPDYTTWMPAANYSTHHPTYYLNNLPEKSLEHYLAAKILQLQPDQVYIDIASQNGVAAEIYSRLYGVQSYIQDLDLPAGLNGRSIGGDAAGMPLPDNFAHAMALHCSFEHFEGDADIRFIREVERVLRPGGACVIVPLYLRHEPAILTNPRLAATPPVPFDIGVPLYATRTWHNRHGRFYSIGTFTERIWKNRGSLNIEIRTIQNFRGVHPSCYARYLAVITKPV